MDEAQVKELIANEVQSALQNADTFKPLADELTRNVQEYMSNVMTPLETRLSGLEDAATSPEPKPDLKDNSEGDPDSPLTKRLAALEQQLEEAKQAREAEKAEKEALEFDGHVTSVLQQFNPQFMNEAKQLFRGQLGDTKREGDRYLTTDGKTVQEAAIAFFDTDIGKHFLPSKAKDGMNTPKPTDDNTQSKPDVYSTLVSAFS